MAKDENCLTRDDMILLCREEGEDEDADFWKRLSAERNDLIFPITDDPNFVPWSEK